MLKKSIWKKFFLIAIGILMFIACSYAENIVKPDGGNPLLKNLRVTRTWAPTGSCISTLDAKWVEPEVFTEAKKLVGLGELTVLFIHRDIMGWKKDQARVYGALDPAHAAGLWVKTKPIMDLIDFAIPATEVLSLEWWDTYSQYRILFTDKTAADIDKLALYINEMIAKDAMPKATSKKPTGGRTIVNADNSWRWHVGKGDTMAWPDEDILGPHYPVEYIRPSSSGLHRVVLDSRIHDNLNPFIYEADTYRATSGSVIKRISDRSGVGTSNGWWPSAIPKPSGPGLECFKALTELVDDLARIANKYGLQVSDKQKQALFDRFAETECNKPRPGGGPPARGYSDKDKDGV